MILCYKYLVPKGYIGLTIFPFIFLKDKKFKTHIELINHEKIHIKQQLEFLILPFFVWYGIEFLVRFYQYKSWHLAYINISFEREAFANECKVNYLNERRFWQFLKYLRAHDVSVK
ncbi:MAG: hypothetical protein COZ17_07275 [Flavobacteriaceae bacterium CG_4_10_14_3_um_filter_33_47]|nr:MAG: hypothetical protein COW44_03965 [Flavobacteriaceae bacterium CG17_big_fil_post_rev_8_21_14_2_50_33_15]PIY11299.1 MAG: hypothetical protein COZ17_07275 [Flavobacteriaceae bacterium CG_4_10_14_3_um_filter_33_47]PJB20652.1 MAG: hypothetical protein CO117_00360 [Flavobacteriaceae bacterium CG_4_9_14_3_um_filter_33_16]